MKGKVLTFVAVFWLLDIVDGSYSSILSSGEEECFRIQVPRHSPVMIRYDYSHVAFHIYCNTNILCVH
jgi:hypothetical protein